MTVYVDDMRAPYGRMVMCHMFADTTKELIAMADAIGVARKHIQKGGSYNEHFDIAQGKRRQAVSLGAVEINRQQVGKMLKWRQATGWNGLTADGQSSVNWEQDNV